MQHDVYVYLLLDSAWYCFRITKFDWSIFPCEFRLYLHFCCNLGFIGDCRFLCIIVWVPSEMCNRWFFLHFARIPRDLVLWLDRFINLYYCYCYWFDLIWFSFLRMYLMPFPVNGTIDISNQLLVLINFIDQIGECSICICDLHVCTKLVFFLFPIFNHKSQ